ncbi:MAG: helix-turn-helix domain-containing protein [Acidimicrobiales bacterium]|nr:helix-turn-helix transcriptional regulator [Acidimicrobiales bacterium]
MTVPDRAQLDLLDALGRRWGPRIVFELSGGALGFNELRKRCDNMSPSVLSRRLVELDEAGLVQQDDFEAWELTTRGYTVADSLAAATATRGASGPGGPVS